jgi:hypothetical protein
MSWEELIIKNTPSEFIKNKINQNKGGKYIGILPVYWNTLGIYKKNKRNKHYDYNLEDDFNNLSIGNQDQEIETINTTKHSLIVEREFYYQKNNKDIYFPVYQFPDDITFTIREIKNKIKEWLSVDGFNNLDQDEFDIFRIYKMTGFHLFVVLLNHKQEQIFIETKIRSLNPKSKWVADSGIELLNLTDKEIINPFMKVSQYKHNLKTTFPYELNDFSNNIWCKPLKCMIDNDLISYTIKWEEIIATLSNIIDSNPQEHIDLYFIANIITVNNNNLFNKRNNIEDTENNNKKQKK